MLQGDDEVWGQQGRGPSSNASSTWMDRDRRMALQLQAQELGNQQRLSPQDQQAAEEERQRRMRVRMNFVQRNLESFAYVHHDKRTEHQDSLKLSKSGSMEDSTRTNCSVCSICLEPFQPGARMARSNASKGHCPHEFHYDCIAAWLVRKAKCPICRETFLEADWKRELHEEESPASDNAVPSSLSTAQATTDNDTDAPLQDVDLDQDDVEAPTPRQELSVEESGHAEHGPTNNSSTLSTADEEETNSGRATTEDETDLEVGRREQETSD